MLKSVLYPRDLQWSKETCYCCGNNLAGKKDMG